MSRTVKKLLITLIVLASAAAIAICVAIAALSVKGKSAAPVVYGAINQSADEAATEVDGIAVITYGKNVLDELKKSSRAGAEEGIVEYSELPAEEGLNLNFNATKVKGVNTVTGETVEQTVVTMPEKLVYFINCGSQTNIPADQWAYSDADENDPYFDCNTAVFEFYEKNGSKLINHGITDQETTDGGDKFGHYTKGYNAVRRTVAYRYPFNTAWVTSSSSPYSTTDCGYMLTGLTPGQKYTLYLGVQSFWHQRSCALQLNGNTVETVIISPSRDVATLTDVECDANGKINIKLIGAATNEGLCNFIALQKSEDTAAMGAVGADITSDVTILGMEETEIKLGAVVEGEKLQIYSGARPYNILYEQTATAENFAEGAYTLKFDTPLAGESVVYIVQITQSGVGKALMISITDVEEFTATRSVEGYTNGPITLTLSAKSKAGLLNYTVQKDYEPVQTFELNGVYEMNETYVVEENGTYEVIVYSNSTYTAEDENGNKVVKNVSYAQKIEVVEIDPNRPVLTIAPAGEGWDDKSFSLNVSVDSIAPVEKYDVLLDGALVKTGTNTKKITLDGAGRYELCVTNAAGVSTVAAVAVGNTPVYSTVTKQMSGKDLELKFQANEGFEVASLSAYQINEGSASKLSVIGNESLYVYDKGTYVAVLRTKSGATEVYRVEVTADEVAGKLSGGSGGWTATIITAVIFGVALIALAVLFFLYKKRKLFFAPKGGASDNKNADATETGAATAEEAKAEEAPVNEPTAPEEAPANEPTAPEEAPANEPAAPEEAVEEKAEEPAVEEAPAEPVAEEAKAEEAATQEPAEEPKAPAKKPAAKSAGTKSGAAKTGAAKSTAAKSAAKSAGTKSGAAKSTAAKSATTKKSAAKPSEKEPTAPAKKPAAKSTGAKKSE